jgi:hypothetical protein
MRPNLSVMKARAVRGLQISALQMLQRFFNSGMFRVMLRAFIRMRLRYRLYGLVFTTPKSWATASPEVAQLVDEIEALRNKSVQMDAATDKEPKLSQAMTWGVAGFALLALTQIVTAQSPQIGAARWVACGCFALVVPWLAVLGFVVHDHMDPKRPPTVQQCLNMHAAMYAGNFVFCLGLASLLWSYNPSIAVMFVLSGYVAIRRFMSYAKKRAATAPPPASVIVRLP